MGAEVFCMECHAFGEPIRGHGERLCCGRCGGGNLVSREHPAARHVVLVHDRRMQSKRHYRNTVLIVVGVVVVAAGVGFVANRGWESKGDSSSDDFDYESASRRQLARDWASGMKGEGLSFYTRGASDTELWVLSPACANGLLLRLEDRGLISDMRVAGFRTVFCGWNDRVYDRRDL